MNAPLAYTVHPGGRPPTDQVRELLTRWLPANGINPNLVCAADPIHVLPVPYPSGDGEGPWMVQVIVFHQQFEGPTGAPELDMITGRQVKFQRTVPLRVPFPTESLTDGEDHGQADRQAAQETPQDVVRHQEQEGVPDRHEGESDQRPGQGQDPWNEGTAKGSPGRGDEAVPEPEEDRPQEEVGAR